MVDFPSGPLFPLDAGDAPVTADLDIRVLNRLGNSAPFFIFPLANPYVRSGNDVVDAHLLDWSDPTTALRPIGLTVYGGRNAPYVWFRTPPGVSSWDFFDRMLATAGVVGAPGSGFGPAGEGYFRLTAFGSREQTEEAVDRIRTRLA